MGHGCSANFNELTLRKHIIRNGSKVTYKLILCQPECAQRLRTLAGLWGAEIQVELEMISIRSSKIVYWSRGHEPMRLIMIISLVCSTHKWQHSHQTAKKPSTI